jgi:hypothetical protein
MSFSWVPPWRCNSFNLKPNPIGAAPVGASAIGGPGGQNKSRSEQETRPGFKAAGYRAPSFDEMMPYNELARLR